MSSNNVAVIGLQWGDEGKGKIVDSLAEASRYVARFCGGANAGHTVLVGDEKYVLHLIPCGILTDGVINVIGNGVVFDPAEAVGEINHLRGRGVKVGPENLKISADCHMVMPWHKQADTLSERMLSDGRKIGTTARGIGPCYADKASRSPAMRVRDLLDADGLADRIREVAALKTRVAGSLYDAEALDVDAIVDEYVAHGEFLAGMIANTGAIMRRAVARGERILFEGGQGSMLDVDHGTYPFVTSSSVTACGIPVGLGISPCAVGRVVGLTKAYTTRVGAGPFPTEQDNAIGNYLRQRGREYGATTGRPRRCGWFDAFAVRYTADISGVSELALSLLDVLTGLDEIKVCVGYERNGRKVEDYDASELEGVECVYESFESWKEDISDCRTFGDLPAAARSYVETIEKLVGRPAGFISVGAERGETIVRSAIEGLSVG
jgi:adenylosuccinate synthase